MAKTLLLSLPPELRAIIFSSVLETVHCRYPVLVWDHISIARTAGRTSPGIGILLACQTTYQDCIAMLYDSAVLHMSVRGDTIGITPWLGNSLGRIEKCAFLERLRHVQMEISYRASKSESVNRVVQRINKLSTAFKNSGNLKSIELIFFDDGSRRQEHMWRIGAADPVINAAADPIVEAVMKLVGEEVVAWVVLKEMAGESVGELEQFREITFDYWEHAFRLKN